MNFYLDEPNGSLKGGDPGIRLIEPSETSRLHFYDPPEMSFKPREGEFYFVPVYRIFGSEELSSASPAAGSRIENPFILLNRGDCEKIHVKENELIRVNITGNTLEARIRTDHGIPDGIAGLSIGLPGMSYFKLPGWGNVLTDKM
jgi:NADH-quinone oxidoreductase subunit G